MRWLPCTLLACQRPLQQYRPQRALPPVALSNQPLESEEIEALAGIWQADLTLDDGDMQVSLHLDAKGHVHTSTVLPFNICLESERMDRWDVSAPPEGNEIRFKLQLGVLSLEGKGTREGLRCSQLSGSVLEGRDDPCCVGHFRMGMVLPTTPDVSALEARHQARLNSRPAPPLSFERSSFAGRWRLLIKMDPDQYGGDAPPAFFALELRANQTFSSVVGDQRLSGSWGIWAPSTNGVGRGSFIQPRGTSLWLKVDRNRCSETRRGIADLPVRESFSMWGKPQLSLEAELGARASSGSASADQVQGRLACGEVERAYFGMFSLVREGGEERLADGGVEL